MKGLIIAGLMVFAVVLAFITGAFTAQSGLMVAGFCGLPFAMFTLGWAAKSTLLGKRIMIVPTDEPMIERPARQGVNHVGVDETKEQRRARRLTHNSTTDQQM